MPRSRRLRRPGSRLLTSLDQDTLRRIQREYSAGDAPWVVAYSGGKDSSALLKLVYLAMLSCKSPTRRVTIAYSNTGVMIPAVHDLATDAVQGVVREAQAAGLPMTARILSPDTQDSFFVRVIGRGYPPPTNKFRWCTERLLVKPMRTILTPQTHSRRIVLLGTRFEESSERASTLQKHRLGRGYYYEQTKLSNCVAFCPIVRYSTPAVWRILAAPLPPESIRADRLADLYGQAVEDRGYADAGVASPRKPRFGCWTCTVVRRDRTLTSLVGNGHPELAPLLAFRNWLQEIREDRSYRCARRRNGAAGPGPLTLAGRRRVLRHLLATQASIGRVLITPEERRAISALWRRDRSSDIYMRLER